MAGVSRAARCMACFEPRRNSGFFSCHLDIIQTRQAIDCLFCRLMRISHLMGCIDPRTSWYRAAVKVWGRLAVKNQTADLQQTSAPLVPDLAACLSPQVSIISIQTLGPSRQPAAHSARHDNRRHCQLVYELTCEFGWLGSPTIRTSHPRDAHL